MANIRKLHPGIYIKNAIEAMEMTSKEFSIRTGISERTLSPIINEKGNITFDVAFKLSNFFGSSINYWTNLQTQYDLYLKEEENRIGIEKDWELLKTIKKYLVDYNYINKNDEKSKIVETIRKLVGVNYLYNLNEKDLLVCFKEQNNKKENDLFKKNFWIALALTEARKKLNLKYNKEKLKYYIGEIRALTTSDPKHFYPRLQEIFADCGISFVVLPYLSKSNIYGVTKWFNKDNVMIAISNRGESADLFWFTIFHEISHVLMEHRREVLLNIKDYEDNEADKMATDFLIPAEKWNIFINNQNFTKESIEQFAAKIGILPRIVLGRLHKEIPNMVPYGKYDKDFNTSYHIFYEN